MIKRLFFGTLLIVLIFSLGYKLNLGMGDVDGWLTLFFVAVVGLILLMAITRILRY